MTTVDELFEQFKQLPDFERYPLPESFYKTYNLKKPQPASLTECILYSPPAYQSLNENGKVEVRGPAPGGVREIKDLQQLPVEVKRLNDETGELEEFPPVKPLAKAEDIDFTFQGTLKTSLEPYLKKLQDVIDQTADGKQLDLSQMKWNLPTADNKTETQPE